MINYLFNYPYIKKMFFINVHFYQLNIFSSKYLCIICQLFNIIFIYHLLFWHNKQKFEFEGKIVKHLISHFCIKIRIIVFFFNLIKNTNFKLSKSK